MIRPSPSWGARRSAFLFLTAGGLTVLGVGCTAPPDPAGALDKEIRFDASCRLASTLREAGVASRLPIGALMTAAYPGHAPPTIEDATHRAWLRHDFNAASVYFAWSRILRGYVDSGAAPPGLVGTPDHYDWSATRRAACDLAAQRVRVAGTPLIWHGTGSMPGGARVPALDLLRHVRAAVSRHRGSVAEWVVVNEPMHPNSDGLRAYLRDVGASPDLARPLDDFDFNGDGIREPDPYSVRDAADDRAACRAMGDDLGACVFVRRAFREARRADPGATLLLNETRMEGRVCGGGREDSDDATFLRLVDALAERRLLDAVGLQMHCRLDGVRGLASFAPEERRRRLFDRIDRYARRDVAVHFTEVTVQYGAHGARDDTQEVGKAEAYQDIVRACMMHPWCRSLTFWQPTDLAVGTFHNSELFHGASYRRSAAYHAVLDALRCAGTPPRHRYPEGPLGARCDGVSGYTTCGLPNAPCCAGEVSCVGGAGCVEGRCRDRCTAQCCDGSFQGPGDYGAAATCRAMGDFACAARRGASHTSLNDILITNGGCRCGGVGDVCCSAARCDGTARCEGGRCAGQCYARCLDGSLQGPGYAMDVAACRALASLACRSHGGFVRVELEGERVAEGSVPCGRLGEGCCEGRRCEDGRRCDDSGRCVNQCYARCCDGSLQGPGRWADDETCRAMGEVACFTHGGATRIEQNQRLVRHQPCCGGYPELDGARGAGPDCATCLRRSCCAQGARCGANPQCGQLWACALECLAAGGAGGCGASCPGRFPAGVADFRALVECRSGPCGAVCAR